jgi:hypothetical protein
MLAPVILAMCGVIDIPDKKVKPGTESPPCSEGRGCVGSKEEVNWGDVSPKSKSKNWVFVKRSRSLARSSAERASGKVSGEVELRLAIWSCWLIGPRGECTIDTLLLLGGKTMARDGEGLRRSSRGWRSEMDGRGEARRRRGVGRGEDR